MFDPVVGTARLLTELVDRGFRFTHPRGASGDLIAIQGVRVHDDVTDVLVIRAEHEAKAVRMPGDEEDILSPSTILWQTSGHAYGVVLSLLMLEDRTEPGRALWRPPEPMGADSEGPGLTARPFAVMTPPGATQQT